MKKHAGLLLALVMVLGLAWRTSTTTPHRHPRHVSAADNARLLLLPQPSWSPSP